MKKILGLDLGTTSIGWALVNEAENSTEKSSIIKLGVKVNPLTVDEQSNFEKGKAITTNADRALKHGMRIKLQRYKLRRDNLIECMTEHGILNEDTVLGEEGNFSTFQTYRCRAKAATEEVTLEEFARILLMINKKRGYKSNRKAKGKEEGQLIDGMSIAKELYERNITPGEYVLELLCSGKKYIPDFYRSDLANELERIWNFQQKFHPDILTDETRDKLNNKNKTASEQLMYALHQINAVEIKGQNKRLELYKLRVKALSKQLTAEELVAVISDVNGNMTKSSGYLGAISDRSKVLTMNNITVGQYLMRELDKDPHLSLKNQTFYRQDYLDEFERIWECQSSYHQELTRELKEEIRDMIIFYQRPLKSKKGMLALCTFENWEIEIEEDGKKRKKKVGRKVCPKSSPLFQEFKIWQVLNNLTVECKDTHEKYELELEEKQRLFKALTYKEKMSDKDALKLLYGKAAMNYILNYKELEGNRTMCALYRAFLKIVAMSGHDEYDINKLKAEDIEFIVSKIFELLGISTEILQFDSLLPDNRFERQPLYMLWHLLYSYEDDTSPTGDVTLKRILNERYRFNPSYAAVLANVTFQDDYASLSTKAIRKILPFLKEGNKYDVACMYAGYNHSERSLTKEQLDQKTYVDHLDTLPRNSLRNPVVEKILNQMINVVNQVCLDYGKPDEIRIELARELKKNAKERERMTQNINASKTENEKLRKEIEQEFNIAHVSKNDLVRYKLYQELKENGYKTLYTNTYIPREKVFDKSFEIEHIIPQARLFDDSFSNKTLETHHANQEKEKRTAYDYVLQTQGEDGATAYKTRIDKLYENGQISKAKHDKLLMREADIPSDFIERDLRNSQYIAKKAYEILGQMVKFVVPTTGSITERLRKDWQLVDVMQELNWEKYDRLGMTYRYKDKDGREIRRITDWTKRNDHRHHAMDALTIAFTRPEFIQYLNNLNANSNHSGSIYATEQKYIERINGKRCFCAPIPLDEFRAEAKKKLAEILVSIKAKNKVMTRNVNHIRTKNGTRKKVQLTPRGQLHEANIYGHIRMANPKEVKVNAKMTATVIRSVTLKEYRDALAIRLEAHDGDAKKAFTGKNSLEKNPLWLDEAHTRKVPTHVKIVTYEDVFPIRKEITPALKIEKVIDRGVKRALQLRLEEYGGDAKKAFTNLEENPIYLNKEKGIKIKRARITGIVKATPLRTDSNHKNIDFVNTGNNHHCAIFRDESGKLQEHVVSFMEAVERVTQGLPIIDKHYREEDGWRFLFTMKQNEYFIFPEIGFNPLDYDLTDPKNYSILSPHLYRVQKFSVGDYSFRHHLETHVNDVKELKDIAWKRISAGGLEGAVKVRVNHVGNIVAVGEY